MYPVTCLSLAFDDELPEGRKPIFCLFLSAQGLVNSKQSIQVYGIKTNRKTQ